MPIQDGWAPTRTARNPQIPNLPLETAAAAGPVDLAGGDAWDHWSDVTDQQVFSTGTQQEDGTAPAADEPAPQDAWDWTEDELLEFIVLDFPQVEEDPRIDDGWDWFPDEEADDWWRALDYAGVGADYVPPPPSQFFDDPLGFYAGDDAYEVPPDVSDSAPVGPDAEFVPPTPPVQEPRRGGAGGKGKRQRVAQQADSDEDTRVAKRWTTRELEDLDFIMALLASGALDG